jgi:ABC-type Na+ efflux pump permease subunit
MATLVRLVLLEGRRGGLPWLAAASVALAVLLAAFLSQVALTESRALQVSVAAALLRACAVFLVALYVVSSVIREIDDKGLELMLAFPVSRTRLYLGRLAGYGACAVAIAGAFSAALTLVAPLPATLAWGASLAMEAALVAAAALFFTMTLAQAVPALSATLGLYVLARVIATVQLIAAGPLTEESFVQHVAQWAVHGIALVLPPLHLVTRTEWLLYGTPGAGAYWAGLGGMALYGVLLACAGLFDFHRRSL